MAALALTFFIAAVAAAVILRNQDDDGRQGDRLPPTEARPATAAEGSLRIGVPELPATYNPFDIRARNPSAGQILSMVLPQLFDVTADGEIVGRLVEDASVVEQGRTVRFTLAEGARWSDGTPITASDLAFTLGVITSAGWPGPDAGYDLLTSVTGRGRDVTFRFSRRYPAWKRLFSGEDYVLPRHRLDGHDLTSAWAKGPDIGAGPYLLKGSTPGLNVILTANAEWWGGGPGVRDLEVVTVPDATTLQHLFEQGELDVAWMPAFTERIREMEAIEGAEVDVAAPGGRIVSLYFQTEKVPVDVRVASLDLVDRDRLTKVLLGGEADLATSWGRLREGGGWPRWYINADLAGELDERDMAFAIADEDPMASLVARALQHRARSTPLTFDAVRLPNHLLFGEWLPQGTFDLVAATEVQWPDPCWRCRFDSAFAGETNWSRVNDIDDLATQADLGNHEAAADLELELQRDAVMLPLWRPSAVVVTRNVAGVEASAWAPGPFWRVERWETTSDRSVQSTTSSG